MPDEEDDLSYTDYSPDSARNEDTVQFRDSEEELSYSAYSKGAESFPGYGGIFEEEEEEEGGGYAEEIVEEFTANTAIKRVVRFTHMSENRARYIVLWSYFAFGLILATLSLVLDEIYEMEIITKIFPFVAGSLLFIFGTVRFVRALIRKEYLETEKQSMATPIIFIILAVMILVDTSFAVTGGEEGEELYIWANVFIGVVWGVYGLVEAARAFNHAISGASKHENVTYFVIRGLIELVFSILLIYDPMEHIALHLVIFGLEVMFSAITHMPFIRNYAYKKEEEHENNKT
ncbi:MAG: hypothetical protein LUD47_00350 [Clostridia bacterium]|nr:hypothetical protein [Clostridia bacterium]